MDAKAAIKAIYQDQVLVFGHRGASAYAPENTIPAFELAAEQGAHGIELDVQLSQDGHLVVIHDFELDKTTNGTGKVTDTSLADLKTLDAGSWFNEKFAGIQIPTLAEVFESVGESLFINVEIKYFDIETNGIEQKIIDCITKYQLEARVIISSFNPMVLKRTRQINDAIPIGYLYSPQSMDGKTQALMLPYEHEARHPYHEMIDESIMIHAHELGFVVNAWTVNDAARARQLRMLGVNGIITDHPDTILAAIS